MDKYDTFIDEDKHGWHCVLFSNRSCLHKHEVEERFSEFGNVVNVKFHGEDVKGICFVRYQCREDAIRAFEGLECDPQITLLEHRKKQRNGSNSERSQGSNSYGRQNFDGVKFNKQFGRQNNQESGRQQYNRNGDKENVQNGYYNNDMPWGSSSVNGNQQKNDVPWGSSSVNGNNKQKDLPWGPNSANGNSPNGSANAENQKQNDVPRGAYSPNGNRRQKNFPRGSTNGSQMQNDTFQGPISPNRYQGSNDQVPDLVDCDRRTMTDIPNQVLTDIPELVTADGRNLTSINPVKKQYFTAQEVIVANIHPKFGSPYMLHLLDRFEPLAISNIKVEPRTGKRYCHVYFKSAKESQEVVNSFDKKLLQDQRLIVIQSNRLVEAAYFK